MLHAGARLSGLFANGKAAAADFRARGVWAIEGLKVVTKRGAMEIAYRLGSCRMQMQRIEAYEPPP